MVSAIWTCIAFSFGLLIYFLIPFISASLPIDLRARMMDTCDGMATRSIGQPAIISREVGRPSLMEWKVDDEVGCGKVVLDDSMLGDSKELFFDDPDDRVHRWQSKATVLLHEGVPTVLDAELACLGKRWREHRRSGKHREGDSVNPFFEVPDTVRCVSLENAAELILNGSKPEDPATMEDYTRKRFEKYRNAIGAIEIISGALAAAVGFGLVAVGAYVRNNLLDGGGSGPTIEAPLWAADAATDVVVTLL